MVRWYQGDTNARSWSSTVVAYRHAQPVRQRLASARQRARLQDLDAQPRIGAEAAIKGDEFRVHRSRLSREQRIGYVAVRKLA